MLSDRLRPPKPMSKRLKTENRKLKTELQRAFEPSAKLVAASRQPRFHCPDVQFKRDGHFLVVQALDVAENDDLAVSSRERAQRREQNRFTLAGERLLFGVARVVVA